MSDPAEYVLSGIGEYLDLAWQTQLRWASSAGEWAHAWFRGQENSDWEIIPTAQRVSFIDEYEIFQEFKRRSVPMLGDIRPVRGIDWYVLMRHSKIPTRLLDWTESALVALYFALRGWEPPGKPDWRAAAVWMLNPGWLNEIALGENEVVYSGRGRDEDLEAAYLPRRAAMRGDYPAAPLAFVPTHFFARVAAQRGAFTVSGFDHNTLTQLVREDRGKNVLKLVIPRDAIPRLRGQCRIAGISDATVYPDLEGLGAELTSDWAGMEP